MKFLLATPVNRDPLNGGGQITGAQSIGNIQIDDDNLKAWASFCPIEDVAPGFVSAKIKTVTINITGPMTLGQMQAAFKVALSSAYNVVFQ